MARRANRFLWQPFLGLALLFLAALFFLPATVSAQGPAATAETSKPAVVLSPATDSKLTVTTTEPQFCLQVVVQETGGARSADVTLTAYQLLTGEGTESIGPVPHLSAEGCEKATDEHLKLGTLAAHELRTIYITARLDQVAKYTGRLILQQSGQVAVVYTLEASRTAPAVQLVVYPAQENKLALKSKLERVSTDLIVSLPEYAPPPTQALTYEAMLWRAEGAAAAEPSIRLLKEGQDLNGAKVHLAPGDKVTLTLSATLPEITAYKGRVLLDPGRRLPYQLDLDITREDWVSKSEGLALATPEPPRWQTGWSLGSGAEGSLQFDLALSGPEPTLNTPEVISLNRVAGGKVVDSLIGRVTPVAAWATDQPALPGHRALTLNLKGLGPGEYHATLRVTTADGREVQAGASAFVRHHGWLAVVVMALGILFAWVLQNWAGGGRSRALISRRLSDLDQSLAKGQTAASKLQPTLGKDALEKTWKELQKRIKEDMRTAKLEGGATELKAVYDDGKARAEFLLDGQDLAQEFDGTLQKLVEMKQMTQPDADKVRAQAKVWAESLCDQVGRLSKATLEDAATGAPKTLELMRARLKELRRYGYQARLDQVERDLRALGQETPGLKAAAEQIIDTNLTKEAKVKLADDDYQAADQFIAAAQTAHADLRLDQMQRALADLAGQKPDGITPADWEQADDAIQAVRNTLAELPPGADAEKKLQCWQEALPKFTLAQVRVVQASLDVVPADLSEEEWDNVKEKHPALDESLKRACQALIGSSPNAEAGQRHYQAARAELTWLVRDLAARRLERLADGTDQRPMGIASGDERWAFVRARARDRLDALPDRRTQPNLAEAGLIPLRAAALDPLVGRLALAEAGLAGHAPCGDPQAWPGLVAGFGRRLRTAQKHLDDLHAAAAAGATDLRAAVERAEASMTAAWAFYDALVELCDSRQEVWGVLEMEPALVLARLEAGAALAQVGLPERAREALERLETYGSADARNILGQTPAWYERLIGWMDALSLAVAFVLALAGGIATQYVDKATFGSWPDYLTVALWGFGVAQVTSASLGELQKALYKKT